MKIVHFDIDDLDSPYGGGQGRRTARINEYISKLHDVIVLSGSTPVLPEEFQKDLHLGGRLFAVVGEGPAMRATLVTRIGKDAWHTEDLFETRIAPLQNALKMKKFVF